MLRFAGFPNDAERCVDLLSLPCVLMTEPTNYFWVSRCTETRASALLALEYNDGGDLSFTIDCLFYVAYSS